MLILMCLYLFQTPVKERNIDKWIHYFWIILPEDWSVKDALIAKLSCPVLHDFVVWGQCTWDNNKNVIYSVIKVKFHS